MTDYGAILLGGGLTLAGTAMSEAVRLLTGRSERREQRAIKRGAYRLASLEHLQEAAVGYRTALMAYSRDLDSNGEASEMADERLQSQRAAYQAHLYRVDQKVTSALQAWSNEAINWTQGEGSAQKENDLWENAMMECGSAIKRLS